MQRILIIEDDDKTASLLSRVLTEGGFEPRSARDGDEGLRLAADGSYDLFIIDVMMPGRDGFSVMEELRRQGVQAPALFLTARGAVDDRVRGLDAGADAYMTKPFALPELLATVRALLRRVPERQGLRLRISDLEIDAAEHKAYRGGRRVDLTPKEFSLLSFLARHRGEVIGRKTLASKVWDLHFDSGTNFVDVHIRRLRAKIDDPFETKLIHTVRGLGYALDDREVGSA